MLLNRGPSWRQGSRPQPVNQAQHLGEQRFGVREARPSGSMQCRIRFDGAILLA
jgi:hypothetical protein